MQVGQNQTTLLTNLLSAIYDKAMKNPHAAAPGKLGGATRAQTTTSRQREAWARLGGEARAKRYSKAQLSHGESSAGGLTSQARRVCNETCGNYARVSTHNGQNPEMQIDEVALTVTGGVGRS